MKDSEDAIERVLTGLRDADVPVGMERRILDALQDRALTRSSRSRFAGLGLLRWGVAFAGVVAVALAIAVNRRVVPVPAAPKGISAPALVPASADASEVAAKDLRSIARRPGMRAITVSRPVRVNGSKVTEVSDSDGLAREEMLAPSLPPPPMPLTAQEKLLLRVAHKGDPVEVAALNPRVRAERYLEEKAEVEKFFEPKKTGDRE